MSVSRRPIVLCPVCYRADQVRTMQAAYETSTLSLKPPPMPESHASFVKYLSVGMALVGVAVFLSIIILATSFYTLLPMLLTLACLATAVVLSFLGIRHVNQGDEEARCRYPLWDEAMANWARLHFCARDQAVFDPQSKQVLSDSAIKALLDLDLLAEQHSSAADAVL